MAKGKDRSKGVSLAKGPVAIVGLVLLAYGVTAFIFGGHSFAAHPIDGAVNGKTWLGLEVNAWSSLLFVAAGLLLLFGAPLHWAAKSMSLIVGLVLGAASVIALYDKQDVFGIFAANGLTKLVWGAAAALLIVLSLLPRVGKKRDKDRGEPVVDERPQPVRDVEPAPRRVVREERVVERGPVEESGRFDRGASRSAAHDETDATGKVVAPATGTTPESQETTRRQRENGEFA
jgi:hypothetical protein